MTTDREKWAAAVEAAFGGEPFVTAAKAAEWIDAIEASLEAEQEASTTVHVRHEWHPMGNRFWQTEDGVVHYREPEAVGGFEIVMDRAALERWKPGFVGRELPSSEFGPRTADHVPPES